MLTKRPSRKPKHKRGTTRNGPAKWCAAVRSRDRGDLQRSREGALCRRESPTREVPHPRQASVSRPISVRRRLLRRKRDGVRRRVGGAAQASRLLARAARVALTILRRRCRDGIACTSLRCRTSTVRFDQGVALVLRATETSCDANAWRAPSLPRTSGLARS